MLVAIALRARGSSCSILNSRLVWKIIFYSLNSDFGLASLTWTSAIFAICRFRAGAQSEWRKTRETSTGTNINYESKWSKAKHWIYVAVIGHSHVQMLLYLQVSTDPPIVPPIVRFRIWTTIRGTSAQEAVLRRSIISKWNKFTSKLDILREHMAKSDWCANASERRHIVLNLCNAHNKSGILTDTLADKRH